MFGTSSAGYNAATTAGNVGAGYGAGAAGVNSQLLPFLTRELNNPQGYTQQQQGAMLDAAEGGAGGSTAGLTTEANLASARDRNSGGFSGALDDAARQKDKALAGASEGIAAKSAGLQNEQQQAAAGGLAGMQSLDTNAQLKSMGLVPEDLNAQANLNKTNWASDLGELVGDASGIAKLGAGFGIPGFRGFGDK
jgi:hypothetical protein